MSKELGTNNNSHWLRLALLAFMASPAVCHAETYKDRVNANRPANNAVGLNSHVVQVEASSASSTGERSYWNYAPDTDKADFSGVSVHVDSRAKSSSHSSSVAALFAGKRRSIASGIQHVHVFRNVPWMGRLLAWDLQEDSIDDLFPGPVVNHSWVGKRSLNATATLLRKLDYSAISNNVLHVYGVRNKGTGDPLLASAFNGIAVGSARNDIAEPFPEVDELYNGARYRPELTGPHAFPSGSAPVVAAAAVRLNSMAMKLGLEDVNATGQMPVPLTKALLMASASGDFNFRQKDINLVRKFGEKGVSENGMDVRYGAGMLNVGVAEDILNAGSRRSIQDSSQSASDALIDRSGYDYDASFGGLNSNDTASYDFIADRDYEFTTSLVWLVTLKIGDKEELEGQLFDLDLCLVDITDGFDIVAESKSKTDATEHMRYSLKKGRSYRLLVLTGKEDDFNWPYALAWTLR